MRHPIRTVLAALSVTTLLVSGCSSDAVTRKTLPTTAPTLPTSLPAGTAALVRLMGRGIATSGSAHAVITVHNGGVRARGSMAMVNGTFTGYALKVDAGSLHRIDVLLVNSKTYAKLPGHPAGKPWSLLPATGGGDAASTVRTALADIVRTVAPKSVRAAVAAGTADLVGAGRAAGVAAARYRVKSPAGTLTLAIDGQGRPVVFRSAAATVTFTKYNVPVHLQAPAAARVVQPR